MRTTKTDQTQPRKHKNEIRKHIDNMQTMKRQEKHSHTMGRNVTPQNAKRNQHEPRTNTQIMKNQVEPLTNIQK